MSLSILMKIPMSKTSNKMRGQKEMQKHRSWYPFCVAVKDKGAQPTQEANQGEWRGAHSQDGPHVHEC